MFGRQWVVPAAPTESGDTEKQIQIQNTFGEVKSKITVKAKYKYKIHYNLMQSSKRNV